MVRTRQTPNNTSRNVSGTGILVASLSDPQDPFEEPKSVSRFVVRDPDGSTLDVGVPQYQMTLFRNFVFELVVDDPNMITLLHLNTIKKIAAVPVFRETDHAEMNAWLRTYADVSAVDHDVAGAGYVMASVSVVDVVFEPSITYVTSVLSVPSGADKLGVTVLPLAISGHVVAAAPEITGTDLGFSGSQLTDWRWTGFTAIRQVADPDLIDVFAGLEKLDTARNGPGDLRGSANYVFTVRESDASLETAAVPVFADVPFTPHQLVSGTPSESTRTAWCVGRVDPEFVNPTPLPKMASVDAANALTLSGSVGVWANTGADLQNWQRVYESPFGISSPPIHHLDNAVIEHIEVPRDLGLMYNSTWQRLTPFVVDNDSGQDPVTETPRRADLPPPPQ